MAQSNTTETPKKPWYQSKILLVALAGVATIGANLLTGFLSGQGVTEEQIAVVAATQPAVASAIQHYQEGQSLFQVLSEGAFALIAVWRAWFSGSKLF